MLMVAAAFNGLKKATTVRDVTMMFVRNGTWRMCQESRAGEGNEER